MNKEKALETIEKFCTKHECRWQIGTVGFGRECVGIFKTINYVDYAATTDPDYEYVFPSDDYDCESKYKPESIGVYDAYHKHDCLCVLVRGGNQDRAIIQLGKWCEYLESKNVSIVSYATGAVGMQANISGVTGYTLFIEE